MADALKTYREKRDFNKTPEPAPEDRAAPGGRRFCVQKHDATRLHYDFRIEMDGVMKSWAVTKGPSLDPSQKRLAVRTEDHPVSYADFEGRIPEDEYGGGSVIVWDHGRWAPEKGLPEDALNKGEITFELFGERLKGRWALVRMNTEKGRENWLLIKQKDDEAADREASDFPDTSVKSGLTLAQVADREETGRIEMSGSKKAGKRPQFKKPQLAQLVDEAPEGEDWIHEMKYDGYRLLAAIGSNGVRLYTRNEKDWTDRFKPIADALGELDASALIDGEAAVLNQSGLTDFSALQTALSDGQGDLVYFAFDLLELGGEDYRDKPLETRKAELARLLNGKSGAIRYADHVAGRGDEVYDKACESGAEGIISKKKTSKYREGRGSTWRKVKCTLREEAVIVGWSPSDKDRAFASLLLATCEDGDWVYRGRVGTGFDEDTLDALGASLKQISRKTSPLSDVPRSISKDACWVTPKLVAEVEYTERTKDGRFRHPAFLALREDKEAEEVSAEPVEPGTKKGKS